MEEVYRMKNSKHLKDLGMILLGNFVVAFGVSLFTLPNHILTGGVAGVSVALEPIFHIDTVLMINVLTISLFILGALLLGKEFALKSITSTICYPIFVTVLSSLVSKLPSDVYIMEPYLASIYSGVTTGIGLGIVFRANASTGGMDILALILNKFSRLPKGNCVMVIDSLTVLLGIYAHGLSAALIGVMSVFVSGQVINRTVVLGAQSAKNVLIISEQWAEIQKYLLETVDRGVTVLEGRGGYTDTNRPVLMCVIDQKQYPVLEKGVNEIDPKAFMIVTNVNEVHGSGFTYRQGDI